MLKHLTKAVIYSNALKTEFCGLDVSGIFGVYDKLCRKYVY
jgi:hypothetical protein